MNQLPSINNTTHSGMLYGSHGSNSFGNPISSSRIPFQNPNTQLGALKNQVYYPSYTQNKIVNRRQIYASNAQKLMNLEQTSQKQFPVNIQGPVHSKLRQTHDQTQLRSQLKSIDDKINFSQQNSPRNGQFPVQQNQVLLPQITSPAGTSRTQISTLKKDAPVFIDKVTTQKEMLKKILRRSPNLKSMDATEKDTQQTTRTHFSLIDQASSLNSLNNDSKIQNQKTFRRVEKTVVHSNQYSLQSKGIKGPGKKEVMKNERIGRSLRLDENSEFNYNQVLTANNSASPKQSHQGLNNNFQQVAKGHQSLYGSFQELVVVKDENRPFKRPNALARDRSGLQTIDAQVRQNQGKRTQQISRTRINRGAQKLPVHQNINFKYPEMLKTLQLSSELKNFVGDQEKRDTAIVLQKGEHQFKMVKAVYHNRHKRYLSQISANKTLSNRRGLKQGRTIQVSFLAPQALRSTEAKVKTCKVDLPELHGFLDLEDKVLMNKLTKEFLEECGLKLGEGKRLKHMFAPVQRRRHFQPSEGTGESQVILSPISHSGNAETVAEELNDISDIFSRELGHIYVAMRPQLLLNGVREGGASTNQIGVSHTIMLGLGASLNIDSAQSLLPHQAGCFDRSESDSYTMDQANSSPLTNQMVAEHIDSVRKEERRVNKIKFINTLKAFEKEELAREAARTSPPSASRTKRAEQSLTEVEDFVSSERQAMRRSVVHQSPAELSVINERSFQHPGVRKGQTQLISVEDQDTTEDPRRLSLLDVLVDVTQDSRSGSPGGGRSQRQPDEADNSQRLRWVNRPSGEEGGSTGPQSRRQRAQVTDAALDRVERDLTRNLSKKEIICESIKKVTSKLSLGLQKQSQSRLSLKYLPKSPAKGKLSRVTSKSSFGVPDSPTFFVEYNKVAQQLQSRGPDAAVDMRYASLAEYTDLKELEKTTPFNRQQLYDFYTKFKALSKFHKQNLFQQRAKRIKKERIKKAGRKIRVDKDPVTIGRSIRPNTPETPKMGQREKISTFKSHLTYLNEAREHIGVDLHTFRQGLQECRRYNQSILEKIFESLDSEGKGYLNWEEFHEGMKIVCSDNETDKVDLFLRMVDDGGDEGNGSFDLDEITAICLLTFEKGENEPEKVDGEPDILAETADFQARNIFTLLGFDVDDEIPIDVFKHHIFHGNEEARRALRQFCCLE